MNRLPMALGIAAVVAGLGISGNAAAVPANRDYLSHGTANCQSALPVFDGNIRKRPMALGNEGTTSAFVTCDPDTINNAGAASFTQVLVVFSNRAGGGPVSVDCTLVDGFITGTTFLPKNTGSFPVGGNILVQWTAADNGGLNFRSPALSCNLPAGVDINGVLFNHIEDVGL